MAHPLCKKLSNTWMTAIRTNKGTKRALFNNKTPTQANEKIKKLTSQVLTMRSTRLFFQNIMANKS